MIYCIIVCITMYIIIQQHLTKKDENEATGGKNVKLADDAFCKIKAACRLVSSMGASPILVQAVLHWPIG